MRHGKKRNQLNRFTSWHEATLHSMSRNLLMQESIRTTLQKAKAVKPLVDDLISMAKRGDLSAKRRAFSILQDHRLVMRLFNDIGPRFARISGGYTRIINLGRRRGDDAQVVIFELTQIKKKEVKRPTKHKQAQETPEEQPQDRELEPKTEVTEEKKSPAKAQVKEKPPATQKPSKKFLGGIRKIFKKERDSL